MKILFFGDVVGRDARDEIISRLPGLRRDWNLDAVIVNGENAASGFGITAQICDDFYKAGVDCITTGNHIWDQREIIPYIDKDPRLLRPENYPKAAPGKGHYMVETAKGKKLLVINLMGRLFMETLDDPFAIVDAMCAAHPLKQKADAIFVDMHAEAASEKMAMAYFLDGRVSCVIGSHTHVPTADSMILPQGTGYQTDAGMCGPYNSVCGFDPTIPIQKFTKKLPGRFQIAEGAVTLCGVFIETDDSTGKCLRVAPVRLGGVLPEFLPKVI